MCVCGINRKELLFCWAHHCTTHALQDLLWFVGPHDQVWVVELHELEHSAQTQPHGDTSQSTSLLTVGYLLVELSQRFVDREDGFLTTPLLTTVRLKHKLEALHV